jgi:HK97 family phage prohead protease
VTALRKFASAAEVDDRTILAIASDATVDRVGDVLLPSGCIVPPTVTVCVNHDGSKPVADAAVRVTDSAVIATIKFPPKGISQLADEWCGLAKSGVINAVSVGFTPIESEPRKSGGWLYKIWEVLEISLVSIPCNPNALILQRSHKSASNCIRKACGRVLRSGHVPRSAAALVPISESPAAFVARKRLELERSSQTSYAALDAAPLSREERLRIVAALRQQ